MNKLSIEHYIEEYENIHKSQYTETVKSLKRIFSQHNRMDLLKWFSALGSIPGNERVQNRMNILIYVAVSIPENSFKNNPIAIPSVKKIIENSDKLPLDIVEDYQPSKTTKKQTIGLKSKTYNYFNSTLENPSGIIRVMCNRLHFFEDIIKKKCGYSIINEIKTLLEFQTNLIDFLDRDNSFQKYRDIIIPDKDFVDEYYKKILSSKRLFSPNIRKKLTLTEFVNVEEVFLPSEIDMITNTPIIDGIILAPWDLLMSIRENIVQDIGKNTTKSQRKILKTCILNDVFETITQTVPKEAILMDFEIDGIPYKFDFGFFFDDSLFIIKTIPDELEKNGIGEKIIQLINSFSPKKKLTLMLDNKKVDFKRECNIYPIIVIDYIIPKRFSTVMGGRNPFIITDPEGIRYIFEDIDSDKRKDLGYLSKCFDKYKEIETKGVAFFYNFCDYYETVKKYPLFIREKRFYSFYPHAWDEAMYEKSIENPPFDISLGTEFPPFYFRTKKLSDNSYYGRNNFIGVEFFSFLADDLEIKLVLDEKNYDKDHTNAMRFVSDFIMFFLQKMHDNGILKDVSSRKTISLVSKNIVEKKYNRSGKRIPNEALFSMYNPSKNDKFFLVVDNDGLPQLINKEPTKLFSLLVSFLRCNKEEGRKIVKFLLGIDPKEYYNVKFVKWGAIAEYRPLLYPTIFDQTEVLEILKDIADKESFKIGTYEREESKTMLNKVIKHIEKILTDNITNIALSSIIEFSYRENENVLSTRDFFLIRTKTSVKYSSDNHLKILSDEDKDMQWYSPICRYILEKSLSLDIKGTSMMTIKKWRKIIELAKCLSHLCTFREFLYFIPDYFDIKIKVHDSDFSLEMIIDDNPFEDYLRECIENSKKIEVKAMDSPIEEKEEKIPDDKMEELGRYFYEGVLGVFNKDFNEEYGFDLRDYLILANASTVLMRNTQADGLIRIKKSEIIDILHKRTEIEEEKIQRFVELSTLNREDICDEGVDVFRTSSRKNRLLIKPIVEIGDICLIGPNSLGHFANIITSSIQSGNWLYSKNKMPTKLRKSFDNYENVKSKEFEDFFYGKTKEFSDFCENNICKRKNNKCFQGIEEQCPGQVDVLSIHKNKKIIIVWETKKIKRVFGASELSSQIGTFDKKFIKKLEDKADFVSRNIDKILQYFKIKDVKGWKVVPVFVMSDYTILNPFLSRHINIVVWDEAKDFVINMNGK